MTLDDPISRAQEDLIQVRTILITALRLKIKTIAIDSYGQLLWSFAKGCYT
jgi:hypothetical protein